jgi:ribose 5-phosphate isomerase B
MRIAMSADHRGTTAAKLLADKLRRDGHEVQPVGESASNVVDYPEPAYAVGKAIAEGKADMGLLICGTGIGMSIAANKVKGVRAAVVHDELTAQISRSHNDANVLCLSADLLGQRLIEGIVDIWLKTPFEGGRHARRVNKIRAIEDGKDPARVVE